MTIRKKAKEKFYQNNTRPSFDDEAKKVYKNFMNSKEKIKDKTKKRFFESVFPAASKYIGTIANYDKGQLDKMDNVERMLEIQDQSNIRKVAHNALVSKVSSVDRLFSKEGLKNLFNIKTSDRNQVAQYASKLVMGDYLTNERGK